MAGKLMNCEALAVRYVHDAVAGEFLNIAVVLYCQDAGYLRSKFLTGFTRVTGAFPDADPYHLKRIGRLVEEACLLWESRRRTELSFDRAHGLSALMGMMIPPEDAALQLSPVLSGVTRNPEETLNELFERYVGQGVERRIRPTRDEEDVWKSFAQRLPSQQLVARFTTRVVKAPHYEFVFEHAWKNGKWNALAPVSLDLLEARNIRDKAATWAGRLGALRPRDHETEVVVLVGAPSRDRPDHVRAAAKDGLAILQEGLKDLAQVVPEAESKSLVLRVAQDLAAEH